MGMKTRYLYKRKSKRVEGWMVQEWMEGLLSPESSPQKVTIYPRIRNRFSRSVDNTD